MLTAKQEKFALNIFNGINQAEAYRDAYPNQRMSDKTIWESASRLMKNPKVVARIEELRADAAKGSILTARERLEYLSRVITGEEREKVARFVDGETVEVELPISIKNKLNAVDLMNKMQGEYVQKVEADVKSEVNINIELSDE